MMTDVDPDTQPGGCLDPEDLDSGDHHQCKPPVKFLLRFRVSVPYASASRSIVRNQACYCV
jgi:hypothetical protein